MLRILLWGLAIALLAESIVFSLSANLTVGLIVLYLITALFLIGAVFYRPISLFLSHGIGIWIKWIGLTGILVYVGLMVFLAAAASVTHAEGDEEAIVVLGAGLNGYEISGTLQRRLEAAYDFACEHPELPVVVTGGQGPGELRTEASAMKEYLLKRGIPEERIFLEDRSASTRENFIFAQQVLRENGLGNVTKVAFVTNRFHCYRAAMIAGRAGMEASAVPATISLTAALPCYLREVLAVLYYWLIQRV